MVEHIVLAGRRGRGIAELIRHLSHLDTTGWIYLAVSIAISVLLYYVLCRYIPILIRKVTRASYPFFTWVAVPQYNKSIAFGCFLLFFCFVGFFSCDDNDVGFFSFMGVFMGIYMFLSFVKVQHSFMLNQSEFYISRFALFGKYKKIDPCKLSLEGDSENNKIIVKEGDKKICRIRLDYYSAEAQRLINLMLKEATWTSV